MEKIDIRQMRVLVLLVRYKSVSRVAELMGISTEQAIAVGDGANDLPMMMAAGLSIAYHPKPAVRDKALISIMSGGMDRALQILR